PEFQYARGEPEIFPVIAGIAHGVQGQQAAPRRGAIEPGALRDGRDRHASVGFTKGFNDNEAFCESLHEVRRAPFRRPALHGRLRHDCASSPPSPWRDDSFSNQISNKYQITRKRALRLLPGGARFARTSSRKAKEDEVPA